jgi:GNAT superfamily N-acetyltransferase
MVAISINPEQHADYRQKFKDAVRGLFPILCFTPEQTEAFIQEFEPQLFDDMSRIMVDNRGQPTFCRYFSRWEIEYIIPSSWEDRYTLVKAALHQLKAEFLAENGRVLHMIIEEDPPSHAAYYMGYLPELGFELRPRATMIADQDLVSQLQLPELMPDIQETPFQADHLNTATYIDARAFGATEQEAERQADGDQIDSRYSLESTRHTWTGLTCEGKLIGFAFGADADNRMMLEEVSLLPEFHGKGLGRYLVIRCLQKLHENFGGPNKQFFLGTDRRWSSALKLYHRLGFTIDKTQSYAILTNTFDK